MNKVFRSFDTIFFDFDGVIKDSVEVKSIAFEQLFIEFGKSICEEIRSHHENNGGMSRFDKLPLYIRWSGQNPTSKLVDEYSYRFSQLVKDKVINSAWVEGVVKYLNNNHNVQQFFIVTATPQKEIEEIISKLKIIDYFVQIIGSPIVKGEAVKYLMSKYNIIPSRAVMIGDSKSDYKAALDNNISFILRKTSLNINLQHILDCKMVDNFV